MKHDLCIEGYCYRLRPVNVSDAELVLRFRMSDRKHTRYMPDIPNDVELEEQWIRNYYERAGDYFFVVENKFTKIEEGIIAIYDEEDQRAQWGRWIVQRGSMASIESVWLLYRIAFEKLGLSELYCRTIEENTSVVSFHSNVGLKTRGIIKDAFSFGGRSYNAVEQYLDREDFDKRICGYLKERAYKIYERFLKGQASQFVFHHLGIACEDIKREAEVFHILGYQFEKEYFADEEQGVRGTFGTAKKMPRIELLENLKGKNTLTPYIERGIKIYHYAYGVDNIEKASDYLKNVGGRIVSPIKRSKYFNNRICFVMMQNMLLVELIEKEI